MADMRFYPRGGSHIGLRYLHKFYEDWISPEKTYALKLWRVASNFIRVNTI